MSDYCLRYLMREHEEVEAALGKLEDLLAEQDREPKWGEREEGDFRWIMEVVGRHLDLHMRKEDEVFFPALEAYLPADTGPLAVLRGEHNDLREIYARLSWAEQNRGDSEKAAQCEEEIERSGSKLARLVRDHMYKEDHVLFPMVARLLPPERDTQLLREMERIDRARAPMRSGQAASASAGGAELGTPKDEEGGGHGL